MTDNETHPGQEDPDAAADLNDSAALYHDLVETSQDLTWQCDAEGRYTYLNPAWEQVFGHAIGEMLGKSFSDFQTPEMAERDQREFALLMHGGSVRGYETTHIGKSGQAVHLVFNAKFLTAKNGTIAGTRGTAYDVTERRRAEEALRASEESLREAQRLAHIGNWKWTVATDTVTWSEELYRIHGCNPDLPLPAFADMSVFYTPESRARLTATVAKTLHTGEPYELDLDIVRPDRTTRLTSARGDVDRDASGKIVGLHGTVQDITERRIAEKRLMYIVKAVESTSEAIGISDAEGHHFYQNKSMSDLFEYATAEELEAAGGGPAVVNDPAVARDMFDAIVHGRSWAGELEMVTKSGRVFQAYERADAIKDHEGNIVGLIGIVSDISKQKHSEEVLRNLMKALDTSGESVFLTDLDGIITYVNSGFTALYGFTADEVVGKVTPRILKSGLLDSSAHTYFWNTLLSGQEIRGEYTNRRKDGNLIPVEGSASPIVDDARGIVGFLGIQRDITTRKQAEEARDKMEAQFLQAQKMEAVGRLAGGVAHDFNNMLGVISGYAELAMGRLDPADPTYGDIQEIAKAGKRSADLVRQLLAFARQQTIAPKILDLNDAIAAMLKMLNRLIGEEVDLLWRPAHDLWPVKMDPAQIDQILANLVVNARDAIVGVGRITIETDSAEFDEGYCASRPGFVPGRYVRLAVSDDGSGMDRETITRIFEPFFTTKPKGQGTGLGLSTVFGIVTQNRGFINVDSEPGHGTTFTIYLPVHEPEGATTLDARLSAVAPTGSETVLLVEDEDALLKLSRRMLEQLGYTVLAAGSPTKALELAGAFAGEIQLLLTDVVLPGMSGRDLQQRLIGTRPGLKCLFMSGYPSDVITRRGVLDEGVRFLQKPFSRDVLARTLREVIA